RGWCSPPPPGEGGHGARPPTLPWPRGAPPPAAAAGSLLLLASRVILQPVGLDVLGLLLVLLGHHPLAPVVELVRLEALLLGHGDGVAVLAVLDGHTGLLGLGQKLRRGRSGKRGGEHQPGAEHRDGEWEPIHTRASFLTT